MSSEVHKAFGPLFKGDLPEANASAIRGRIAARYGYLQTALADSAFLMGETFTVADAYAFTLLRWSHGFGIDLQLWPNVADYYERIRTRPAVIAAFDAEGLPVREVFRRSA